MLNCLIHTGCRIPVLFRKGLCPELDLSPAKKKIKIVTADGSGLAGGQKGSDLSLRIPIKAITDSCDFVCVSAQWGYEANITNVMIFGFPFLREHLFIIAL